MAYAGGVVAAAAAKRRRMLEEMEEEMAQYTQDDLARDWEFKIVRSGSAAFRKPEVLKHLLEEEARAGWVMLEKFDDSRIRFKRRRRAGARDALLSPDIDPYRTRYGAPSARYAVLAGVSLTLVLLGVATFIGATEGIRMPTWPTVSLLIGILLVAFGILMVFLRRARHEKDRS